MDLPRLRNVYAGRLAEVQALWSKAMTTQQEVREAARRIARDAGSIIDRYPESEFVADAALVCEYIDQHPPASTVSADEPATLEMEREVDDALGLRLLKVRVPEALAVELHTEADRREVPLAVVMRERLSTVSAGADAVEAAVKAFDAYWDDESLVAPCPDCNGEGYIRLGHDPEWCDKCGSTGEVSTHTSERAMQVVIDAAYPILTREVAELRAEVERWRTSFDNTCAELAASEAALREAREDAERLNWLERQKLELICPKSWGPAPDATLPIREWIDAARAATNSGGRKP